MDIREFERIKGIISKAEIESAKAQGKIDNIKKSWLKDYGTDDINEIVKIYAELEEKKKNLENRMGELYNKIKSSCDWDELERKLNG